MIGRAEMRASKSEIDSSMRTSSAGESEGTLSTDYEVRHAHANDAKDKFPNTAYAELRGKDSHLAHLTNLKSLCSWLSMNTMNKSMSSCALVTHPRQGSVSSNAQQHRGRSCWKRMCTPAAVMGLSANGLWGCHFRQSVTTVTLVMMYAEKVMAPGMRMSDLSKVQSAVSHSSCLSYVYEICSGHCMRIFTWSWSAWFLLCM